MFNIENLIEILNEKGIKNKFWQGNYGLEKENIRVDEEGRISTKAHPAAFGNKITNPYITIDFAESQMEFITPPCKTLEDALNFLKNIESSVNAELEGEYLWPQSTPPLLPADESLINIGIYDDSPKGRIYREYREKLAENYGRKKQLLSGIHYNFSFTDEILSLYYKENNISTDYQEFKNDLYLKLSRNFFKYRWLLIYLFGASPAVHESYSDLCISKMEKSGKDYYGFNSSVSFRTGKCGYRNRVEEFVPYNTLGNYIEKVEELISNKKIQNEKEYYSPLRLKSKNGTLEKLKESGIEYLELRLLDLNPFASNGIDIETLYFVQAFLNYMLHIEESEYTEQSMDNANKNHYIAACRGLTEGIHLHGEKDEKMDFRETAIDFIEEMEEFYRKHDLLTPSLTRGIEYAREAVSNKELTLAGRLIKSLEDKSFIEYHMDMAREYKKDSLAKAYNLLSYEDMELSTQILLKEAIKRGARFNILDRKANFITLEKDGRKEYVKQATKTALDSYMTYLIMENKLVSKEVLASSHIRVPMGYTFDNIEDALGIYHTLEQKPLVIKPNNTNFGLGISIFKEFPAYEKYREALEIAFKEDHTILIEEFIRGKEYRFLVMCDEVVGILHRVPANVEGDGTRSIRELVEDKNKDPLRGKGYKSPLEKINLGRIEEVFLEEQGLDSDYIPQKGEIIYLRENSNISTGGDSIDFTDDIHGSYKVEAIKAAKSVGAKICGVDMMIEDIKMPLNRENYGIIEVNFNPAIHIHTYPYKGSDRKPAKKILDMLGM